MKKISDLMKEMGFNPQAQDSAKEAFIKHLIKASTGHQVITPTEKRTIQENPHKIVSLQKQKAFQQMEFNFFEEEGANENFKKPKSGT